jgi:hypothetical protein
MSRKKNVRASFRSAVFERDSYHCAVCGKPGYDRQGGDSDAKYHRGGTVALLVALDAHHITDRHEMPNGDYVVAKGISLCDDGCHRLAEVFHQTGVAHPGYAPVDLYARIGSSFEAAVQASAELT